MSAFSAERYSFLRVLVEWDQCSVFSDYFKVFENPGVVHCEVDFIHRPSYIMLDIMCNYIMSYNASNRSTPKVFIYFLQ